MSEKEIFSNLYTAETVDQWKEEKTMEHSSGIWGRTPMLEYLEKDIIKKGDTVVDLGSGAGYPSLKISNMVGKEGKVIGIELSKAQLGIGEGLTPLTEKYKEIKNLSFVNSDIKNIPLEDNSADEVVSFMVLHNIKIGEIKEVFAETNRVMKADGKAIFLTMHPDFLESDWDLTFTVYDKDDLKRYKEAKDKEGIEVKGIVKNAGGGEKAVGMCYHSVENMQKAIEEAGLKIVNEKSFFIDEKTAKEKFGENSVRKLPENPAFLMMTLEKIK